MSGKGVGGIGYLPSSKKTIVTRARVAAAYFGAGHRNCIHLFSFVSFHASQTFVPNFLLTTLLEVLAPTHRTSITFALRRASSRWHERGVAPQHRCTMLW